MPMHNTAPAFAALCGVDARDFAGLVAYDRGPNVTMSSEAYFGSLLALLNSYGSQTGRDLQNDFRDQWIAAFGGTPTVVFGINADDRLYASCTGGAFDLDAGADNAFFGFDAAGQSSVAGGGTNTITAVADWSRDQPTNKHLVFSVGATTWSVPSVPYRAQGIPTMVRKLNTIGDLDDVGLLTCLESLDNTATDPSARRHRWGVNAAGYVWTAYENGVGGLKAPTWTSAGAPLRKLLGFRGDESAVTIAGAVGDLDVVTATDWPEVASVPTRPLARLRERFDEDSTVHRTRAGELVASVRLPRHGWDASWYLDGPAERSRGHRHFFGRFLGRCHQGERVELVIGWPGETRRAADPRDQSYGVSYTVEGYADRGRIMARRSADDASGRSAAWPGDGATARRTRLPITMRLEALEEGV